MDNLKTHDEKEEIKSTSDLTDEDTQVQELSEDQLKEIVGGKDYFVYNSSANLVSIGYRGLYEK